VRVRRLVLLCAPALVPTAGAGSYTPPPGDCCPAWSPDGRYVSFLTKRGGDGLHDVKPDGTAEQTLAPDGTLSPAPAPSTASAT
jgi:hypothetical protein